MHQRISWYLTPIVSMVLALPTLLSCLTFWSLVTYESIVKDTKGTLLLAVLNRLPPSLFPWSVLYAVFGPLFACILCTVQLTRSPQANIPMRSADGRVARVIRTILLMALVSICFLILTIGIARIIRGST